MESRISHLCFEEGDVNLGEMNTRVGRLEGTSPTGSHGEMGHEEPTGAFSPGRQHWMTSQYIKGN